MDGLIRALQYMAANKWESQFCKLCGVNHGFVGCYCGCPKHSTEDTAEDLLRAQGHK